MSFFRSFITLICLFCLTAPVWAKESIRNFDVSIKVDVNGDFTVTETIEIQVEGQRIKRGIFRDLPRYKMVGDTQVPVQYDMLSIRRNDQKEPYSKETDGNALRFLIGDETVYLEHKTHTYEITYTIDDEIRRDETFDEVYWNVTGNYWQFPIDKASVYVKMPDGSHLQSHEAFTGSYGKTGTDASYSKTRYGYHYTSNRPLAAGEGLTVSFKYDKGIFGQTPTSTSRLIWWAKNGAMTILSLSFLLISLFYYRSWNRVGRDPIKDPVFARYKPPDNYSAAGVSHLHYKGIRGNKALIATLIGLAVKNHIHIDANKTSTTLKRLTPPPDAPALSSEESLFLREFFPPIQGHTIRLKKKYNAHFTKAHQRFEKQIRKQFSSNYHKFNISYIIIGIVLSVICIAVALSQTFGNSQKAFWGLILALIILNLIFAWLMPAPTKKGQKLNAEIDGFKLYLETAEKQKLNAVKVGEDAPPPMSVKHYEAMLPFAIAMGVEAPWTKHFEKIIPIEAKNYDPVWTSLSRDDFRSFRHMTDNMMSNINSGVSSARPQSSGSSSSSSGGGFSGGGGGGGGGGGW